jgi:glycosyltransferase involved in cell wall biosynthesis
VYISKPGAAPSDSLVTQVTATPPVARAVPVDTAPALGAPSDARLPARRYGRVSIVVPTHNDEANIGPLLTRLLEEDGVGEVLVVASECADGTVAAVLEVAASAGDRIRLYVEPSRSGKAAAVNFGVGETTLPIVVVVSGDVLIEPGAIEFLAEALCRPGVGLAGGRPVPVNDPDAPVGHAVHLLWRLHHRLALHQPKLGEMIALRSDAVVALPPTSVDEACFQALLEPAGWVSAYVPEAVVRNRGPGSVADFVKQRRQVHAGHLWLRRRQRYTVPSLHPRLLLRELWHDLTEDPERLRPKRLAWTAGAVGMEAWARLMARLDYLRGRENHVWAMVESAKAPALDADWVDAGGGELLEVAGLASAPADQRHDQHQLPL